MQVSDRPDGHFPIKKSEEAFNTKNKDEIASVLQKLFDRIFGLSG